MINYKLNKIEDVDVFYFCEESQKTLGETLVVGTFNEVLIYASQLKDEAVDAGAGNLVDIVNPLLELSNIMSTDYYLLQRPDGVFQVTRPDGLTPYSLPTNAQLSAKGSLENIFAKIIEIEIN